jgi:hypothetical protein
MLESLVALGDFAASDSLACAGAAVSWEDARALLGGLLARGVLKRTGEQPVARRA